MSSTEELFARYGAAYRPLATVTALLAAIAVILSATIVNVAIPDVMGAFGIDQVQAQWLSTGFLAAMTATMLLSAWADRALGQRATMIGSLVLFALGSVLGGLAPNESVLTFARVLQGACAGVVQPLAMVVVFNVYPAHRRGAAMGLFGVGVVLAPALGPWVGGLLIDTFDWRAVFYLGVPFAAIAAVLSMLFLPSRSRDEPAPRFDWIGILLLSVLLIALLSAFSNGQRLGWGSDPILFGFATSLAAAVAFVWWERRTPHPMLDLRLFESLPFTAAAIVSFVLGAGLFGSTYLLPLAVQTIQGYTPTQAGLMLMPAGFVLALVFPIAGRLSDRVPAAALIALGLIIFAYASYAAAEFDVNMSFATLAFLTVLTRLGLGFVFPPLSVAALRVLPRELVGQGSGTINFTRQLGGAFGVNLLAVALERRTAFHADALTALQTAGNAITGPYLGRVAEMLQATVLPDYHHIPASLWYLGQAIYAQARTEAFRDGFLITALVFVVALLPTWLLHRALRADEKVEAGGRSERALATPNA
ncbi:MAG TPA: DHA2 family efflux MFS transporter permease subunit [Steroidobacter sp.]